MSITFNNLWRWRPGRQETGYEKMLIAANSFIIPFDCYRLRFKVGVEVPEHIDPVDGKRHYRINVIMKKARYGGIFWCSKPIYASDRLNFFRPDQSAHSVSKITEGTRYVLSIGWIMPQQ